MNAPLRMANPRDPSAPASGASWLGPAGIGATLALAVIAVYWPALRGGILIDDLDHITRPAWRSLAGLRGIWFNVGITSQYFPLLHSAFWVEYRLWQDSVVGYHLANLAEHLASAILVVAIARRLRLPGGWLAGFLFALHPVGVESVAWISEQKNTLSTLFYLVSGYLYLGFDQDRRPIRYWLAFGFFVLALLTKSITAMLVPALLVIAWWQRGRLEWRRDVRPLIGWLVTGAAYGLFTVWYERVYMNARGASFDQGLMERSLIAGRAVVFYARTLVWPTNLMFVNPRWQPDLTAAWQYAYPAAVGVVAGGLTWLARWRRGPLAAFLLYTGTLAPTLGFLNINWFNYSFVADHFQYLAGPAFFISLSAGLTGLVRRWGDARAQRAAALAGGCVVAILGGLNWRQSGNYRDAETLYRRTIAQNPAAWIAHANLGAVLLDRPGGRPEAVDHFLTTLTLKPNHLNAYINLGLAFERMPGRESDAVQAFESALRLKPDEPRVLILLAQLLAQMPERVAEAAPLFRRALAADPSAWEAHAGLAQALAANAETQAAAIPEWEAAVRLRPDLATLHNDLGGAYAVAGRTAEAIAEFEQAVRLRPDLPTAHYNLASLLSDVPGRLPDAVREFEAALQLGPDDPAAHNNLGLALLQLGRRSEAIAHLRTAVQLAPASADGHFSLGRALLAEPADEAGALREFETALQLRPDWPAAQRAVARLHARLDR